MIAVVDLDGFRGINDALGHQNGDQLLTKLAARISSSVSGTDTVARLGGDEFGLILGDVENAQHTLEDLRTAIEREVEVCGIPLCVQGSIGYAVAPGDGADADQLLQHADVAMYAAKERNAGVARYSSELNNFDAAHLSLIGELRHAIDAGQLVLHYQPQTAIDTGKTIGVEALLRWMHPVDGLLPPDRFLPLAEQTDLIDRITTWVLHTAISEIVALGPAADGLTVSINVSARSFGRVSLGREIIDTVRALDFAPQRLVIEVTETALLADPERAGTVVAHLAAHGVQVSLDDFGCGQTSLSHLSALDIRELKIDKDFVIGVENHHTHGAIAESIIYLGHKLGLRIVPRASRTPGHSTSSPRPDAMSHRASCWHARWRRRSWRRGSTGGVIRVRRRDSPGPAGPAQGYRARQP